MTYLFVGAGQAGSAIVDAIFEYTDDSLLGLFDSPDISTLGRPMVFNSTIRDLQNLSNVPPQDQYGIAETEGLVEGTEPGFESMVTGGFGRDPVQANDVMTEHAGQLQSIFSEKFGSRFDAGRGTGPATDTTTTGDDSTEPDSAGGDSFAEDEPDLEFEDDGHDDFVDDGTGDSIQFAFVFLGLGGGTGCGIAPHLAREISEYTDGRAKVIAVAILPSMRQSESDGENEDVTGGRQAWNARYGLDRLEEEVDGIILVDNQRISYLASAGGQFGEYNEYVASAIYDLVAGPVFSSVDPSEVDGIDTPDIDVRDIVTSLSFGVGSGDPEPGYGAIGRSVTMTQSLAGYLLPFVGEREIDSGVLARLSASKQTLSDADVTDAQKAISLIRAPGSTVSAADGGVETGTIKRYHERSCNLNEVNIGVALSDRQLASVTTLFTYRREDIARVDEIERAAEAYEEETEELLL